jgi:hypothetical protein
MEIKMSDMKIYVITNKINGKKYVGQTIRDLDSRLKRHINDAKKGGSCAGCSGGCSSGHCETAEKFKELHKKRELEQLRSKKL